MFEPVVHLEAVGGTNERINKKRQVSRQLAVSTRATRGHRNRAAMFGFCTYRSWGLGSVRESLAEGNNASISGLFGRRSRGWHVVWVDQYVILLLLLVGAVVQVYYSRLGSSSLLRVFYVTVVLPALS